MAGNSTIKLSQLIIGEKCVIDSFTDEYIKLKLMEMGCLPGEVVTIDRFAPMGDPIAILVADSVLCIRKDEADSVIVSRFKN